MVDSKSYFKTKLMYIKKKINNSSYCVLNETLNRIRYSQSTYEDNRVFDLKKTQAEYI